MAYSCSLSSYSLKMVIPPRHRRRCITTTVAVIAPSGNGGASIPRQSHIISWKHETKDLSYKNNPMEENRAKVRSMLSQVRSGEEAITTVDSLKRLGIDHHFDDEISSIIDSIYRNFGNYYCTDENDDLFKVSLRFRLLRENGYDVSSDIFDRFMDNRGEFKQTLSKDIKGLLSLHDASNLNMGEEILYKAKDFSTLHLNSCLNYLEPKDAIFVRQTLVHPYHMSLQQYKARQYLNYLLSIGGEKNAMVELAQYEFQMNQSLYQMELLEITRWWRNLGLARELTFARDQIVKWHLWSLSVLHDPQFSKQRMELTKVIAFIYLIDDIYDIAGTPHELALFTAVMYKWEESSSLPSYMRVCYTALFNVTNEIAQMVEREHGWNPINSLQRSWAELCNAFMEEARWFESKKLPSTKDYLANGIISTGVSVVLDHVFFLLGHGPTKDTLNQVHGNPPLISCPAKILRLWDDLGSALDENQKGYDGSYVECYMKENPNCCSESAREHVKYLISKTWEELNREYFSNTIRLLFSPHFTEASINSARMVGVMYSYDQEQRLPLMEEYTKLLFLGKD